MNTSCFDAIDSTTRVKKKLRTYFYYKAKAEKFFFSKKNRDFIINIKSDHG
jgi:hypothetical protein